MIRPVDNIPRAPREENMSSNPQLVKTLSFCKRILQSWTQGPHLKIDESNHTSIIANKSSSCDIKE